ncbi:AcrR family transcriptional regulator [Actinoplanes tereljensis]|uniref:TetR family transcriptional regulator n=1 Tax=Paractinoplanes tereljensis TaxID=571912 RepID=A0A919TW37_9ACTN|nr:TetR/AcrR family transcriptional regulator [Actinoplanes tereljensis]GIF25533.1 TetR family transcriptional regulator [Actinoplanes tereljensis]
MSPTASKNEEKPSTRRARGKTERYWRMRDQVIDIAVELFSKNGYASTGVADIGEAAGLARGALYYYIKSKEALLAEIHDRVMDPLLKEAAAIAALDLSFPARLRLMSESLLWQVINRHDHVWVFLHEYRQLEGEFRTLFKAKRDTFEQSIQAVLEQGQREGLLRPLDLELTKLTFLNMHNYTYQWVATKDVKVEDLSGLYCEIFLNGILTSPATQDSASAELEHGRAVLQSLRDAPAVSRTDA